MDKAAFYKLIYGLYVVSSRKDDQFNGQIANTLSLKKKDSGGHDELRDNGL
jgi:hypothetical protein